MNLRQFGFQFLSQLKNWSRRKQFSFRAGLHAASHALLNVVPLYLRCNSSDLAPECPNPHDSRYFPERILVYDQHPGGTGVSMQIQPYFTELLNAALELLTCCHCSGDTGCPNCVQSMVCHEYNEVIHKDAAIMIIESLSLEKQTTLPKTIASPESLALADMGKKKGYDAINNLEHTEFVTLFKHVKSLPYFCSAIFAAHLQRLKARGEGGIGQH
ncbi:hypothetical protein NC651_029426 [Populus alba x Populus x berolinensis]|nr:hypothetical protein NC651_029426 [Populus alba x Populus x berolinensis]